MCVSGVEFHLSSSCGGRGCLIEPFPFPFSPPAQRFVTLWEVNILGHTVAIVLVLVLVMAMVIVLAVAIAKSSGAYVSALSIAVRS